MTTLKNSLKEFRDKEKSRWKWVVVILLLLLVSFVFDIATGPALLSPTEVSLSLAGISSDGIINVIVREYRLPIALMAIVAGASLGIGGAQMQTVLNNKMASPYTLGMAAASGFGASMVLVLGVPDSRSFIAVPLGAFVFAMLSATFLLFLAARRVDSTETIILGGIALLFMFQSLTSVIQFISSPELSQQILFWLFGSINKTSWKTLGISTLVTAVGGFLMLIDAWKMTALSLGEDRAVSLGVNVRMLRVKVLIIVAIITATITSFVGVIGFIGLIAPYIARFMVGGDHRTFLIMSMVVGSIMLSLSSIASKIIIPGALFPIGIVTAIVGVPFMLWIIFFSGETHVNR